MTATESIAIDSLSLASLAATSTSNEPLIDEYNTVCADDSTVYACKTLAAIEALYRQQKAALLRERIRRAIAAVAGAAIAARALYVTLAVLLSAYGVQLALYPIAQSCRRRSAWRCALHVAFRRLPRAVRAPAASSRRRRRRQTRSRSSLATLFATASSSWHLLLVARSPPSDRRQQAHRLDRRNVLSCTQLGRHRYAWCRRRLSSARRRASAARRCRARRHASPGAPLRRRAARAT
jgi:hypothetical protein